MAEGKGLGRGLNSLLGILDRDEKVDANVKNVDENVKIDGVSDIELSLIDNNPNQPRKNFDATALNELAESIKRYGVVQPVVLVKRNNRYLIVAGERRFRASKIAGLKKIPAVVRDYNEMQIKEISLLENLQREDLNPIECAKALDSLLKDYGWTQEILADKLGKSRPSIANTLRLLALSKEVIELVESGKLSAGHARSLVVVSDPEIQLELAKLAITKRITVRELEKAVKDKQKPVKYKSPIKEQSAELKDFTHNLERRFGTSVVINGTDKKGKITFSYYNKEDLNRIFDLLNK